MKRLADIENNLFAWREQLVAPEDLLGALLKLPARARLAILDSCHVANARDRFLIAAFNPLEVIEVFSDRTLVHIRTGEYVQAYLSPIDDALAHVAARLAAYQAMLASSFEPVARRLDKLGLPVIGGVCIAALGYEYSYKFLDLRLTSHTNLSTEEPLATFAFYDFVIVHDYETGRTHFSTLGGRARLDSVLDGVFGLIDQSQRLSTTDISETASEALPPRVASSNFTRDEYLQAVERIRAHIFAGDIYQANLTQRFNCELAPHDTAAQVFMRLRARHAAAHAAFIQRSNDALVSISPERLLRVEVDDGGTRTARVAPIKGTRPRGTTVEEDARLRAELLASAKDRAENVMIVDLMRNDLGRVCEYGSIEVVELLRLEQHPTLFHLVSEVRGKLRSDALLDDIVRAVFPCGSITGAPKLRAMEIIQVIEREARGAAMGAIGYFAFDGKMDLSVAIRTLTVKNNQAFFHVGGGITADSRAADEYDETLVKARALLHALRAKAL